MTYETGMTYYGRYCKIVKCIPGLRTIQGGVYASVSGQTFNAPLGRIPIFLSVKNGISPSRATKQICIRKTVKSYFKDFSPFSSLWCARHGQQLGGERPLRARQ